MIECYVPLEEADAYHAARPNAKKWQAMPDAHKEAVLTAACDYVDVMFGLPRALVQQMRSGGEVPHEVKKAVCELAVSDVLSGIPQAKQKTLAKGAMSVTLEDAPETLHYIRRLLAPLVKRGVANIRVERG
ncbi:MAG: hypothetical protein Q4D82_01395 [Neisseria sp.]|nr:hypothetical protein [Neisseria sp.]